MGRRRARRCWSTILAPNPRSTSGTKSMLLTVWLALSDTARSMPPRVAVHCKAPEAAKSVSPKVTSATLRIASEASSRQACFVVEFHGRKDTSSKIESVTKGTHLQRTFQARSQFSGRPIQPARFTFTLQVTYEMISGGTVQMENPAALGDPDRQPRLPARRATQTSKGVSDPRDCAAASVCRVPLNVRRTFLCG